MEKAHRQPGKFQVDFSLVLLEAQSSTPRAAFQPTGDHYTPDCDIAPVPLPPGGRLEGESGLACKGDGDCHLLVLDREGCRLYEMFRANVTANGFEGGCLSVCGVPPRCCAYTLTVSAAMTTP